MFAYCLNNPVNYNDLTGMDPSVAAIVIAGVVVSVVSGIVNGYSSQNSGGSFGVGFAIGLLGSATGYAVTCATQNPLVPVLARMGISFLTNLATTYANNGQITMDDVAYAGADAIMDFCYSGLIYYYNPFGGDVGTSTRMLADLFNGLLDSFVDFIESWIYQTSQADNSGTSATGNHIDPDGIGARRRELHYVY